MLTNNNYVKKIKKKRFLYINYFSNVIYLKHKKKDNLLSKGKVKNMIKEKELGDLKVLKRDNKKVDFNGEKIAVAIKKGFDSVANEDYDETDINKVYHLVLDNINDNFKGKTLIKIEEVQDIVEKALSSLGYNDIYEEYSDFRRRKNESREIFLKQQRKLMGDLESLCKKDSGEVDLKRDNANVDGNTAMGTMLQFGAAVSKSFAKSHFMSYKFSEAHEAGQIHVHDMDFLPMGTTTCMQIDLEALFKTGFSTGHGFLRTPNSIASYSALAAIAVQSNQNDQHGGQSIPAFDFYMAPGVIKTFKKEFKQALYDYLDLTGFLSFVDFEAIKKAIDKLNSYQIDIKKFYKYINIEEGMESQSLAFRTLDKSYKTAVAKTERSTFQAMEAFVHNLNTMHSRAGAQVPFSSINFGTDTTPEGRLVIKSYLLALEEGLGKGETPIFPISIFKLKSGVNYNKEDVNYDLFELACRVSAKRLFPNFSFIDAPFNLQYYKEDDYKTEVAYMGCRTRVMANVDEEREYSVGRGNLSFTTINLPRLGIKYGIVNNKKADMTAFYKELDELLDMVKDQLLERFDYQCTKRVANFPFLLGQGVWLNSKNLKPNDKIRKVLKHGTLSIGFHGLAECMTALTGHHHGEDEETLKLATKIIKRMRSKVDKFVKETNLNFSLLGTPAEGISGRFTNIDKSIYGEIKGVTDREYYTNSFHVPVYHNISSKKKIEIEGPFHALCNAGHITYIELDGDPTDNVEGFMNIVRLMKENGVGYGAVNHPVDRDPVCGFTGVIKDRCPGCNREEDSVKFERIRRITGYLVGTVDRFNNAKRAEEKDRVKHGYTN